MWTCPVTRRTGQRRFVFFLIAVSAFVTLFGGCIFSSGIPDLDMGELEKLFAKEQPPVIVDNRTSLEYASGHIPGAIHIPQEQFLRIASFLPENKKAAIVFYCRGYG